MVPGPHGPSGQVRGEEHLSTDGYDRSYKTGLLGLAAWAVDVAASLIPTVKVDNFLRIEMSDEEVFRFQTIATRVNLINLYYFI